MAIAATNVLSRPTTFIADLSCLDADTTATNIAHGLSETPLDFSIVQKVSIANNSGWAITANATNIVVSKANVVGSGGTTPGTTLVARVRASIPHTIV